jgi:hypothetical protein
LNPVERVIRRVDATQQRLPPAAFVVGVVKKFGDDNGGALVPDTRGGLFRRPATGARRGRRGPRAADARRSFPTVDDQHV